MGNIAVCMCVYNAAETIRKSLDAVVNQVDKVVVVDGAFLGFPTDSLFSNDGTLEILKEYKDKIILIQIPKRMSQPEKRSLYFVEGFDWYLIVDDDDVVEGDIRKAVEKLEQNPKANSGLIKCFQDGNVIYYVRLIHYRPGLHYYGAHHDIRDWMNEPNFWHPAEVTDFVIRDVPRSAEREALWKEYANTRLTHSRQDYSFEGV